MEYFRCESIRLMRFLYSLGFDKKSVIDSKTGSEIWLFEKTDKLQESLGFFFYMRKKNNKLSINKGVNDEK